MDIAEELIKSLEKVANTIDKHNIWVNNYTGSKEDPMPLFVSLPVYNSLKQSDIDIEENDLVFDQISGSWLKLIIVDGEDKDAKQTLYGEIGHISERKSNPNKESMDKFLKGKFKERRY